MMKRSIFAVCAALAFSAKADAYDLVAMLETYSAGLNDTFYTLDNTDRQTSIGIGYVDHGAAFWLPCAWNRNGPNNEAAIPFTANFGYSTDIPMSPPNSGYACAQQSGLLPLYRFYKSTPTTDHFYTTSLTEAAAVLSSGYAFERTEGYLLSSQATGSVPLYRLSRCVVVAGGCDVEHRFTISLDTKNTLVAAGWTLDGTVGYVFDGFINSTVLAKFTGTLNGVPVTTAGVNVAVQNVSPPSSLQTLKGQGRHNVYGYLESNSTTRPGTAKKQRITFQLNTGTLFDAGTNVDHVPIILYGHTEIAKDGEGAVPVDGLGIFLATPGWGGYFCPSPHMLTAGGQIFVEEYANGKKVDCRANLAETNGQAPLLPNHSYDISVMVDDNATLSMTVKDHATQQVLPLATSGALPHSYASDYSCPLTHAAGTLPTSKVYCNNPFTVDRFDNHRTGYALVPVFTSSAPSAGKGVGTYNGVTVQWLDVNDNVVWTQ